MDDDTDGPKLAYRISEAAQIISVSRKTIYRLIAAGRLKTIYLGRVRLVPATALRALIETGTGTNKVPTRYQQNVPTKN
jgi:excisionase family DNA binding protein